MKKAFLIAASLVLPPVLTLPAAAQAADHDRFAATVGLTHYRALGSNPLSVPLDGYPAGSEVERNGNHDLGVAAGLSWYVKPELAIELWRGGVGSVGSKVDIENGPDVWLGGYSARPLALTAQYHFNVGGTVKPFVGAGLQRTRVTSAAVNANVPELDKWAIRGGNGWAAVAGVDVDLSERWFVRGDARYLKTRGAISDGETRRRQDLNSLNYSVNLGIRF